MPTSARTLLVFFGLFADVGIRAPDLSSLRGGKGEENSPALNKYLCSKEGGLPWQHVRVNEPEPEKDPFSLSPPRSERGKDQGEELKERVL